VNNSEDVMLEPDVVTLGEALVLVRPSDATPILSATDFVLSAVGAESNVAIGLARLGHEVAFFGRVGDDACGERIRRALRAEGVDCSHLSVDGSAPTGILVRDVPGPRGGAVDYHRTGSAGSRLSPGDVDRKSLAGARWLHITGLTCALSDEAAAAVWHAVEIARESGTKVCLDPNLRLRLRPAEAWRELVRPLFPFVDVVVTGPDELLSVCDSDDVADAVEELHRLGVPLVVVRSGTDATLISQLGDGGIAETCMIPVRPVDAVDVVGAGDAFAAGLISGLLDDLPVVDAIARAHEVARLSVLSAGDVEGLPTRRELFRAAESVVR
jgi:2-dehydro-3-deoxygluconokinase